MPTYILSDIFQGNYPISQYFGANPSYYSQFGLAGHEGVDWATPIGVQLIAPFDGVILRDAYDPKAYGYYVVIWDPQQHCAVWYCHMSYQNVAPGQTVKRGQYIGNTGNTGNTSGPHLHCGFVETDAYANRLNRANGYQGFRNILNPALVSWRLNAMVSKQTSDRRRDKTLVGS